jgi:hypothetical protein
MPAPKLVEPGGRLSPKSLLALAGVAALASLLHIAPYWIYQARTPQGYRFTGNIHDSPDFIQYRSWMRISQRDGVLVPDQFTGEPNRRHIPVLFYFVLGKIAVWTGWTPEFVFAYAGCLLAAAFTLVLFAAVRAFFPSPRQCWWVFLVLLLGGGLSGLLKLLEHFQAVRDNPLTWRLLVEPIWNTPTPVFEDYRAHYVFSTFLDTHYLVVWLASLCSVMALYYALRAFSWRRGVLLGLACALTTVLQIYQAAVLAGVAIGIALLCRRKGMMNRERWIAVAIAAGSAAACAAGMLVLQAASGLPLPAWRETSILVSILFLAYPLAWLLIAWGVVSYWRGAGLPECFLLGWALACTLITLSGPFFPYPDRGVTTLQIPLYLVAGGIFFARWKRVSPPQVALLLLLAGGTPLYVLLRIASTSVSPQMSFAVESPDRRQMIAFLCSRARSSDVLAATSKDLLWLAPEYPGKHYCGHFFLTVDYAAKKSALDRFFEAGPSDQAAFLRGTRCRFVFVGAGQEWARFLNVPGLVRLKANSSGALFEYTEAGGR